MGLDRTLSFAPPILHIRPRLARHRACGLARGTWDCFDMARGWKAVRRSFDPHDGVVRPRDRGRIALTDGFVDTRGCDAGCRCSGVENLLEIWRPLDLHPHGNIRVAVA